MPEVDTEPFSYLTISGSGKQTKFADVSLEIYLNNVGPPKDVSELVKHLIVTHDLDEKTQRRKWSVFKGLVGSIDYKGKRWALNEGKWYSIETALKNAAEKAFNDSSSGLDVNFTPWPLVQKQNKKKQDVMVYEPEGDFNERVVSGAGKQYLLYDKNLFKIPNNPGPGIEICDLFDIKNKKLIHVKKSGRKSSVISHFLNQGLNSAKLLKSFPQIKDDFLSDLKSKIALNEYQLIEAGFPEEWTVEFKFGDRPTKKGLYTIPFFSRVTFEEVKREIIARGFKDATISFIRMSNPGN